MQQILLFPRLPQSVAFDLANKGRQLTANELLSFESMSHNEGVPLESATFAATGAERASEHYLGEIAALARDAARRSGYPELASSRERTQRFDPRLSLLLHQNLRISPSEAGRTDTWEFFTCALCPDVVRWRWWSESGPTVEERFCRNLVRNAFAVLWWRAELLVDRAASDPYRLIRSPAEGGLTQDELASIVERPGIARNRRLAVALGSAYVNVRRRNDTPQHLRHEQLARDLAKRAVRALRFRSFQVLDQAEIEKTVAGWTEASIAAQRAPAD